MGWIADSDDAINFLEMFDTVGGNNYTNREDEDYQALLKESREELDPDIREDILKEAEEMFMDEMDIAPVYYYTNSHAKNDYVHDMEVGPLAAIQFKWMYITK